MKRKTAKGQVSMFSATDGVIPEDHTLETSDHVKVRQAFLNAYRGAYGADHAWSGRQAAELKKLLARLSTSELLSRMGRLFDGYLRWPAPPYNFATFVTQIDRLVKVPGAPRGPLTAADILAGKARQ